MKIVYGEVNHYYDINGEEIHAGDIIKNENGFEEMEVFDTVDGELGTDSTNPVWIKKGWAYPGEFGIYPFSENDSVVIVKKVG